MKKLLYLLLSHKYSETWELGTPKGLPKPVLNSKVVHFYVLNRRIGTEVGVLNSQVVPVSQVVLKAGFTAYHCKNRQIKNARKRLLIE